MYTVTFSVKMTIQKDSKYLNAEAIKTIIEGINVVFKDFEFNPQIIEGSQNIISIDENK